MIDDKENLIISLYDKGMSISNIEEQLSKLYDINVSSSTIWNITARIQQYLIK